MTTTQPLESTAGTATGADGTSGTSEPARRSRFPGPLLPQKYRKTNRPKLWLEIALIAIGYELYTLTRLAAPTHETQAHQRGWDILHFEHYLGLNFEHTVNHWVYSVRWLAFSMNVYYGTLHFIMPIVVLIWVYVKFPDRYRSVRAVMCSMTLLALFGFYFYSLAPPRLLPGADFIDTFKLLNPWGQSAATSDGVAGLGTTTNEFAAMPSLHIGWSTWCALTIAHLAQRRWVKILAFAFPATTFVVIVGTANHYVLDAAGGLVVLSMGFLLQRVIQGRPAFAPAPPPVDGTPSVPKQTGGSEGKEGKESTEGKESKESKAAEKSPSEIAEA